MGKGATIKEGGYGAKPYAPTRTLAQRFDREGRLDAAHRRRKRCQYLTEPEPEGMWNGFRVQQVLDGGKRFVIEGWPTPIRAGARTELPPAPRKPTYGPAARKEARELMAEAKRQKINLGWSTKKNLCKVAKGECPLHYSVWRSACNYIQHVRWEREREQDLRERPFHFQIIPGQGVQIACR
jgi:hypothetical protein